MGRNLPHILMASQICVVYSSTTPQRHRSQTFTSDHFYLIVNFLIRIYLYLPFQYLTIFFTVCLAPKLAKWYFVYWPSSMQNPCKARFACLM